MFAIERLRKCTPSILPLFGGVTTRTTDCTGGLRRFQRPKPSPFSSLSCSYPDRALVLSLPSAYFYFYDDCSISYFPDFHILLQKSFYGILCIIDSLKQRKSLQCRTLSKKHGCRLRMDVSRLFLMSVFLISLILTSPGRNQTDYNTSMCSFPVKLRC